VYLRRKEWLRVRNKRGSWGHGHVMKDFRDLPQVTVMLTQPPKHGIKRHKPQGRVPRAIAHQTPSRYVQIFHFRIMPQFRLSLTEELEARIGRAESWRETGVKPFTGAAPRRIKWSTTLTAKLALHWITIHTY